MMTTFPPNLKSSFCFSSRTARLSHSLLDASSTVYILSGHGNVRHFSCSPGCTVRRICSKAMVIVGAGYTRLPLETDGAYQLVDDETGEKFIVWGEAGDGSPAPSREVLTWKPQSCGVSDSELENFTSHERNVGVTSNGAGKGYATRNRTRRRSEFREMSGRPHVQPDDDSDMYSTEENMEFFEEKVRRRRLPSLSDFFSRKTFAGLGCSDYMISSLKSQLIERPAHIQALAFSPVIEGRTCVIADQSGSGKTLAYLIPIVQRLRQEELQGLEKSPPNCPRIVVVAPTTELASQVLHVCRSLSRSGVPFRSMVATGGFVVKTQSEYLDQGVDILIATPGRLMFLLNEGQLHLSDLRCAVLDEIDILFRNPEFEEVLQKLISSSSVRTQYLFVTATLPVEVHNKLVENFPDCEMIMGPGVHRTSPGLEEILVDCSGDGPERTPEVAFLNKKSALLQLVEESPVPRTIIFCNKIETCRKVENVLNRFDRKENYIKALPFHSAMRQDVRLANMKDFFDSQSDQALFLVCTDRASRGIDFVGVEHVVLFDFPRDPSEYVRRVGRTARGVRGNGKAFMFVVGKQVSICRKIFRRNQKGHPLHEVPLY